MDGLLLQMKRLLLPLKAAHVDDFIHTLPNGYNMILNEKQAIYPKAKTVNHYRRAILANPIFLF